MVRRPKKRPTPISRDPSRSPSIGRRISDLDKIEDLSPEERLKIERIIREAEGLDRFRPDDVIIVTKPTDRAPGDRLKERAFKPVDISKTINDVLRKPVRPGTDRLKLVTGSVVENLRKKFPDVLPDGPVKAGEKGAEFPIPTASLTKLIQLAAVKQSDEQNSVIWDDGVNQLVVHPGRIRVVVKEGRVRVDIPVEADGLRTSMQVPFSVGSKDRKSGLVMATLDRPAGDATVARIWGDALIALAHGALIAVAENMAGASGRDVKNKRLVVHGLVARHGRFIVESQAGFTFKRSLK